MKKFDYNFDNSPKTKSVYNRDVYGRVSMSSIEDGTISISRKMKNKINFSYSRDVLIHQGYNTMR